MSSQFTDVLEKHTDAVQMHHPEADFGVGTTISLRRDGTDLMGDRGRVTVTESDGKSVYSRTLYSGPLEIACGYAQGYYDALTRFR